MLEAVELEIEVREDGTTHLPGVPPGRARVIVLLPEREGAARPRRALGLPFGRDQGKIHMADDFDVLPKDIQAAFEGRGA